MREAVRVYAAGGFWCWWPESNRHEVALTGF